MMVVDLALKRARVSSASWTISRLPRSQPSQSNRGFTPVTEHSRLPGGVMQGPQHGLQAMFICYAPNEDAALGFRLVPVLAAIVLYRFERLPFV